MNLAPGLCVILPTLNQVRIYYTDETLACPPVPLGQEQATAKRCIRPVAIARANG